MRLSFLPSTAPATPTLQALVNELASVEDWHLLGVNLGLQGHQLREIERNYRGDSNRYKTETLDLWQRNAKDTSWEAIAKGLCLMQEHVVADGIRRKYCCSSTTAGKYPSRKVGAHNKHKSNGHALSEPQTLLSCSQKGLGSRLGHALIETFPLAMRYKLLAFLIYLVDH